MSLLPTETTGRPPIRARKLIALIAGITLVAAACGGGSDDGSGSGGEPREVVFEEAAATGADPFTESVAGDTSGVADDTEITEAAIQSGTAPGLYGGSGDQQVCDQAQLVGFLEENPDKATAWAEAEGIASDEVGAYIESLTPAVLLHDTAVTNHGYVDGAATAHQSVLEAGTAVLKDRFGVPRTRCACGNPLLPPEPTDGVVYPGDPIVIVPGLPDTPGDAASDGGTDDGTTDFCSIYHARVGEVAGGPSSSADVVPYLTRLEAFLSDLIVAAENTTGFPEDPLTDLRTYRDQIATAAAAGDPSAVEGSVALRDAVEGFLEEYCADPPPADEPGPPAEDPLPDGPVPNAECGSFMFFLLIEAAEGVGVDWAAVGQPFLDEMDALAAEIDSPDPTVIVDYEEIGCEGAQAMYDLLVEAGYADALDGSDLDPYA